jgi:hypothetical protein
LARINGRKEIAGMKDQYFGDNPASRATLFSLAMLVLLTSLPRASFAKDIVLPDTHLTPGAVLTTDIQTICVSGYSKTVRHTSGKLKAQIYREYGIERKSGKYEIDHLIPLSIGGADVAENLWPESYESEPWNAVVKDRLELKLHELICHRDLDIRVAQKAIADNWIEAFERFCPTDADCPSYRKRNKANRR